MNVEALWSVEFISNMGGAGAGVAIFENGHIYGGDSNYYYLGVFKIVSTRVEAILKVVYYAGEPNSIFGQDTQPFNLNIMGNISEPIMELSGYRDGDTSKQINLRLTKREELP